MDIIYEIRRRYLVQKQTITAIARDMRLSRPTVRKHLITVEEPKYERVQPISPKLGQFEAQLTQWLIDEAKLARPRRRTAHRLFEGLQEIGYTGAYDSVQRFVRRWKSTNHGPKLTEAFVPLFFQPGDACQFDWSQEQVELGGVLLKIKVAHFRLAYSRQMFVVASGWEKGQVENQVGNVREWLFTPLARFASFTELNDWLATRCKELAQRNHPTQRQRTIAECFADEQPLLRPITVSFDGYVEHMMRVSSTCLVNVDRNRYSVPAGFAGQAVSVRTTAEQIRVVVHGDVIAAHPRVFGRDQLVCDPWHYLPVLEKKPGALRDGVPFVVWDLPRPIMIVRDCILKQPKGDRAFVELLMLAGETGLNVLTVACELALEGGIVSAPIVMNELRRLISPHLPVASINVPDGIALTMEPVANCHRYDYLLGAKNVH